MTAQDGDSSTVGSRNESDPFAAARQDLPVAAAAAGSTIALTLALEFALARPSPVFARMTPLAVYFGYLLVRKRDLPGALGSVRTWVALSVAVAAATFVFYAA